MGCAGSVWLTLPEYEAVRAYATRFATLCDHENPECNAVIREHER